MAGPAAHNRPPAVAPTGARARRYSAGPCPSPAPTPTVQFNLAKAFDTLVETLADRECIVWRDRRLTYAELAERSRRLASYLHGRGLRRAPRARRARRAASRARTTSRLSLYNGNEYLEGMLGSYRARVAPFNVNYRYVEEELRYLLNDAGPRAMILHSSLAPTLAEVLPTLDSPPDVLLQVADESGHALLPGAVEYEEALAASSPERPPVEPSPDDLYILYTGGTTGMPKGVLWRQHDIFLAAMGGRKVGTWELVTSYEDITERLAESFPLQADAPPAAHARRGAVGRASYCMAMGATLVFPDDTRRVDPDDVWATVEREKANGITRRGRRHAAAAAACSSTRRATTSRSFFAFGSGGAPLTPAVRAMALERLPNLVISDSAGSSETGAQMHVTSVDGVDVGHLRARARHGGGRRDLTRVLEPGHEGNGWLAQTGNVPLGYLGDAGQDGAHLPGDRRRALLDPRRPGPPPGRRRDRAARAATR